MRQRLCLALLLAVLTFWPAAADATAVDVAVRGKYYSGTATDGAWRQVQLPEGTRYVVVEVDGAAYVDGPAGGYTDGASRSSGGRATSSGTTLGIPIAAIVGRPSIYVAGSGASRTITVIAYGAEAS